MRFASIVILGVLTQIGCSSDPEAPAAPTNTSDSGTPATTESRIGGIVIPASLPLCTSATGGIFIASGGGQSIAWTWSASKNGGTHYAIKIAKAPPGATTLTTLVDELMPAVPNPGASAAERVSGTYYTITGAIVKDGTPLCTMDGANGVTA
ncbi:MAG: hypothetical protein KBF88_11715 [Polyangiaceae bacterium]|nr:hypothetical protein [Polyangiaceae bacterium]